jgi:hypothetical protein
VHKRVAVVMAAAAGRQEAPGMDYAAAGRFAHPSFDFLLPTTSSLFDLAVASVLNMPHSLPIILAPSTIRFK